MEYKVQIKEVLERTITIDAQNEKEALRAIRKAYDDSVIVLDWEDLVSVSIENV